MSTSEGQPELNTADKPGDDDTEGHVAARAAGDDDVEGRRQSYPAAGGDDDVEGHRQSYPAAGDDDDVEGHLRAFKAGEGHLMRSDEDDAEGAPEFRA